MMAIDIAKAIEDFQTDGYVIFRDAIDHDLIDRFWRDVDNQIIHNPYLTWSLHGKIYRNSEVSRGAVNTDTTLRIIDMESHSQLAARLMLHESVQSFLEAYYGYDPTAIQTLTYKFSSEQGAHSDLYLVSPPAVGPYYYRDSLAASWVACEDATEENGALVIYPGSHKLLKKPLQLFNNEDGSFRYGEWVAYLEDLCARHGSGPELFLAKKGDVLIWHGDFVHAGGRILNRARTRKSLVTHYARVRTDEASADPSYVKERADGGWYFRKRRPRG
ncbi:MAG: phytanoyl-CoA dioxygenase family protein [Alphaproteobacteria bacterium]|nr:phytanoyl-CoA dioxygenase family protein [Alphaproteobacteria bacterium]